MQDAPFTKRMCARAGVSTSGDAFEFCSAGFYRIA